MDCIMFAGVVQSGVPDVEILCENLGTKRLPNFPKDIFNSSLVLHNRTILICGSQKNFQQCLQLDHGNWLEHSYLNKERHQHSSVTMQTATFLFGGFGSKTTYEYLPKDSTTWHMGKTSIPNGFKDGCAIAVNSNQDILLIGGSGYLNED